MSHDNLGDEIPLVPQLSIQDMDAWITEKAQQEDGASVEAGTSAYIDDFHQWVINEKLRNANTLSVYATKDITHIYTEGTIIMNGHSILMPEQDDDDVDPWIDLDTGEL